MTFTHLLLSIKALRVMFVDSLRTFQVQNAVDFLKMIGALDETENLTHLGM